MTTVAITATIVAIALPIFQGYIQKSACFKQAVQDTKTCSLAVEHYYNNNFTHVGTGSRFNSASPAEGEQKYTTSVMSVAAKTYLVTAAPVTGARHQNCISRLIERLKALLLGKMREIPLVYERRRAPCLMRRMSSSEAWEGRGRVLRCKW